MKIEIPEIKKEAFEVRRSIKNIKKMHAFQLKVAEIVEEFDGKELSFEEMAKAQVVGDSSRIEATEKFLKDILNLSEKEVEKLEELERDEFDLIQSRIVLALQGYTEEDIEKIFKVEDEEDPKKEQALKSE